MQYVLPQPHGPYFYCAHKKRGSFPHDDPFKFATCQRGPPGRAPCAVLATSVPRHQAVPLRGVKLCIVAQAKPQLHLLSAIAILNLSSNFLGFLNPLMIARLQVIHFSEIWRISTIVRESLVHFLH